jgi:eukaryotic-like serine/threonine-protein kinase
VSTSPAAAPTTCSRCGAHNQTSARFCDNCGSSLFPSLPPTERLGSATRVITVPPPREIHVAHRADPLLGRIVAERYRVLELIGRGGMGVVYKAEHARIGKVLALKLLTGELTRDATQLTRFKREALLSSQLSHPNTVQVFDFGEADGLAYLAMEYVRGSDLDAVITHEGRLSPARTARIVIQICSSLAEAHEKGIVHRDLKPENIMIARSQTGEDVAKVLDFGLAKLRESSELSDVTSGGAIVGTPYYMAPEQIRGEAIGPECDVYQLGAVLYTCLTGSVVFDAATPMGVLTRHLIDEPQPPSVRAPDVDISRGFERLVLTALAKDPSRRFRSVLELQAALVAELAEGDRRTVSALLDSGEMRKLAKQADGEDVATRDEVASYERTLRRRGVFAWSLAGAGVLSVSALGLHLYTTLTAPPSFQGFELEPNNAASEARLLPFPLDVRGRLGQRLDRERSDRDFFKLPVPEGGATLELGFEPLPNLASCLWLFAPDTDAPFSRYCTGKPGLKLSIPALKLEPGHWIIAVMQDREAYFENETPPVYENVSDDYRLTLRSTQATPERETEPNDAAPLGNVIPLGGTLRGRLAFAKDRDLLCAPANATRVRFSVEDAVERPRSRYSVLEVTSRGGPDNGIPVRVHRASSNVKPTPRDVVGAFLGQTISVDAANPPCVELTLVPNPWGPAPPAIVALPGDEEYLVRLESR